MSFFPPPFPSRMKEVEDTCVIKRRSLSLQSNEINISDDYASTQTLGKRLYSSQSHMGAGKRKNTLVESVSKSERFCNCFLQPKACQVILPLLTILIFLSFLSINILTVKYPFDNHNHDTQPFHTTENSFDPKKLPSSNSRQKSTHDKSIQVPQDAHILVGIGKADATGLIGEITMLGYAHSKQHADGIHIRTYARTFIFTNAEDPRRRAVFVTLDVGFMSLKTKHLAIRLLRDRLKDDAALYSMDNVMITSTHTHSAPAGFEDELLYQFVSFGVVRGQRNRIANAIADSIFMAHQDLIRQAALDNDHQHEHSLYIGSGQLGNAGINRSLKAYYNNPADEILKYNKSVDDNMIVLSAFGSKNRMRGAVSWFPVHGTSMNFTNSYVSGDNKGYASYAWELDARNDPSSADNFVAAFSQSNAGDVSPNIDGARCENTGEPCDGSKNSCNGRPNLCIARGPGFDHFASTQILGHRQYLKAKEILKDRSRSTTTTGPIIFKHAWVDMTNVKVTLPDGSTIKTCPPAMGHSFAAGTTDGPGPGVAYQGDNSTDKSWRLAASVLNVFRDIIAKPSSTLAGCHYPKPILLNTGSMRWPYLWQPDVVAIQLFVIGRRFVIAGVPGEMTTMAGRRLKNSLKNELIGANVIDLDATVVISSYANMYSSYITTKEEYNVQRYEGASTIYGPHTLLAYQAEFVKLSKILASELENPSLATGFENNDSGKTAQIIKDSPHSSRQELSFSLPVIFDASGSFQFGEQTSDLKFSTKPRVSMEDLIPSVSSVLSRTSANASYVEEVTVVEAEFACSHPRNDDSTALLRVGDYIIYPGNEKGRSASRSWTVRHEEESLAKSSSPQHTFMSIEKRELVSNGSGYIWKTVLTDGSWDTRFHWMRSGLLNSRCILRWDVGDTTPVEEGVYRFRIFGASRMLKWSLFGASRMLKWTGTSDEFSVGSKN